MDVSSGDLRLPLLVARKTDDEFSGIFFLFVVVVLITLCTAAQQTRMMGDKEGDAWSRLRVRFRK